MPRALAVALCLAVVGIIGLLLWRSEPQTTSQERSAVATAQADGAIDNLAYLDKAEPLMAAFWQSVDRARDGDLAAYRTEAKVWYDIYMEFAELVPPPEYEEYHRLTERGLSIMAWAGQDIRTGDLITATKKINDAVASFEEADQLLRDFSSVIVPSHHRLIA